MLRGQHRWAMNTISSPSDFNARTNTNTPALNGLDRLIGWFSPQTALRRAAARTALAHYDATRGSRLRPAYRQNPAPQSMAERHAAALRAHARYLERNHDITRGVLRTMVNNIVGPAGIGIEPMPRRKNGQLHTELAQQLRTLRTQWMQRPEVTHRMNWAQCERMLAYTWLRDGEAFVQLIMGDVPGLAHASRVPLSLELLEPDFVPLDYHDKDRGIRSGIGLNAWGQPTHYYCYKGDPREVGAAPSAANLKAVPAQRMLHISTLDRLHQVRGVSELASVLTRVEDLKDYEESERIAAKIAASMGAYIKRLPGPDGYEAPPEGAAPRHIRMQPGMIFDGLQVGEEIGMIDTGRPNPSLVAWRSGQLRALAAGVGASYSSISRDYNGTYSAMRQELVEQWVHYAVLMDDFAAQISRPIYAAFIAAARAGGALKIPRDVDEDTLSECLIIGQQMPWIDPLKEAAAYEKLARCGFASEIEIIRRRGGNPRETMDQIEQWRQDAQRRGLHFDTLGGNGASQDVANIPTDASGEGAP